MPRVQAGPHRPEPGSESLNLDEELAAAIQDDSADLTDATAVRAKVSFQTSTRNIWTFSVEADSDNPEAAFTMASRLAAKADAFCATKNEGNFD